ncbi:MAG: hypothetical protein KF744_09150 [Taibaiella sp.]|nr:hypothetical protein [Taibaiella sp.]
MKRKWQRREASVCAWRECGREFKTNFVKQRCCSRACSNALRKDGYVPVVKRKVVVMRKCLCCGVEFVVTASGKKYCNFKCRERMEYERKVEAQRAARRENGKLALSAMGVNKRIAAGDLKVVTERLCAFFGVTEENLRAPGKYFEVKYVRWIVWKLMMSWGSSYRRAGELWGHRYDHTTIINALERLKYDVGIYEQVKEGYELVMAYDERPIDLKGARPWRRFERRVSMAYLEGKRVANRQRKAA